MFFWAENPNLSTGLLSVPNFNSLVYGNLYTGYYDLLIFQHADN